MSFGPVPLPTTKAGVVRERLGELAPPPTEAGVVRERLGELAPPTTKAGVVRERLMARRLAWRRVSIFKCGSECPALEAF